MTPEKISSLLQDRITYAIAYERTDLANSDGFKNYAIRADGTLYEHASGGGYAVDVWYLESDDADEGETKTVCDSMAQDLFFDWQRMQTTKAPAQYIGPILETARAKMHNNKHRHPKG